MPVLAQTLPPYHLAILAKASPIESEIHPSHKPCGSYSVYFASRGGAVQT